MVPWAGTTNKDWKWKHCCVCVYFPFLPLQQAFACWLSGIEFCWVLIHSKQKFYLFLEQSVIQINTPTHVVDWNERSISKWRLCWVIPKASFCCCWSRMEQAKKSWGGSRDIGQGCHVCQPSNEVTKDGLKHWHPLKRERKDSSCCCWRQRWLPSPWGSPKEP